MNTKMVSKVTGNILFAMILITTLLMGVCASPASSPAASPPSGPGASPASAQSTSPDQARQKALQVLYQGAKAEAEVIWQIIGGIEAWMTTAAAFEKKYPGVKVKLFAAQGSSVPAKIITEAGAGKLTSDVLTGQPYQFEPLISRKLLLKYDWTKVSDVNPKLIVLDGSAVKFMEDPNIWAYNKKLVADKDVPRTNEDLLDTKWKGSKISIRSVGGQLCNLLPEWKQNPTKVIDYLKKLADQKTMPGTSTTQTSDRVVNGECPIGLIKATQLVELNDMGASLGVCPIGPYLDNSVAFYIPDAKGLPHPNAAKLLLAWLVSSEGMAVMKKERGAGMSSPCDASRVAQVMCDAGLQKVELGETMENYAKLAAFSDAAAKAMGWGVK
jgi:iron(III) transport system substrate-binding protein